MSLFHWKTRLIMTNDDMRHRKVKYVATKNRTTIVLGAGASCDLGYPTGEELVQLIAQRTHSLTHVQYKDFMDLKTRLKAITPGSIDQLLTNQSHLADVGRALIADVLFSREDSSRLNTSLYRQVVEVSSALFTKGQTLPSIVTFNYDRSFEEYILRWISI